MIPEYVHGAIAPVFTAFNENGTLDDAGQRNLLDFLVETQAVSAYFVRSGLGQMYTFRFEDVKQILKNVCPHLAGRGPVLAGVAGEWDRDRKALPDPAVYTAQGVELAKFAEQHGADAVVFTMPEAIAPGPGERPADVTLRYFETMCAATDLPVFIYQPPGTNEAYEVDIDLIRKLADMPSIKGMKVSTTKTDYVLDLTWAVADKDFAFISGAETAFYAGLCSGARAVIGQGATINPQILKAIQDCFEEENYKGAIEAQRSTNMLVQEIDSAVEFFKRYVTEKGHPVKPFARAMGIHVYGKGAPPVLTDEAYARAKHLLEAELAKYT